MCKSVLGLSGLLTFSLWAAQAANLAVNSDFSASVPSNGSGGGWTASHNDSLGGWRSTGGNPGGMFILNDNGSAGSDPTIVQTITGLNPGAHYTLSGDYASWYNNYLGNKFGIDIDGSNVAKLDPTAVKVWTPFSLTVTAVSTQMSVRFRAEIDGGDNDFAIDNIGLVAVPEPASIAAVSALGLLAFGAIRRVRR